MTTHFIEHENKAEVSQILKDLEPYIFKKISFAVNDKQDAKDLTQEVLIRIYLNFHKFDQTACKIETWVYRIIKNLCIDFYRRKKPVETLGDEDIHLTATENIEKSYESIEFNSRFMSELNKLPSHYKSAFLLRHVEGRSLNEISNILGLQVNTIKTHIHRAKSQLKKALADYSVAS